MRPDMTEILKAKFTCSYLEVIKISFLHQLSRKIKPAKKWIENKQEYQSNTNMKETVSVYVRVILYAADNNTSTFVHSGDIVVRYE